MSARFEGSRELFRLIRLRWPRNPVPLDGGVLDGWLRPGFGRRARCEAVEGLVEVGVLLPLGGGVFGVDPARVGFGRLPLSRAVREAVVGRDGLVCWLCGGRVREWDVEVDHVVPVCLGGLDVLGNLRVAHRFCNRRRGVDAGGN